jgi:predicted NAD/FAD-dependent oxidoreductase
MEEIPKQLVAMLPENSIHYNIKVSTIANNKIFCENGTVLEADKIIIATEAIAIASAYISKEKQNFHQVTNVYFEAKIAPTKKAVVVLNAASNKKWVNNLTVMSNVSNRYAPTGKVLISISYNGIPSIDDNTLADNMKVELKKWYGNQVEDWQVLKTYRINYALPNQEKVTNEIPNSEVKINENLYICGDHLLNGSINAAMKSGRIVAELINDYI